MAQSVSNLLDVQGIINRATKGNKGGQSLLPTAIAQPTRTQAAPAQTQYAPQAPTPNVSQPLQQVSSPTGVKGLLNVPQQNQQAASYPALVGALSGAAQPNATQTGLIKRLEDASAMNTQYGDQARAIAEKYGPEIARIGKLGAGAVAGDLSTGTNVVGSGNAAIASQSASSRMSALSEAQQAELQGVMQQLAANQQLTAGLNNALTGANVQQQQQIGGLGTAAGYSQPNVAAYGQTVFNPLTGQFAGGGNLDPQVQAQNLAQQVMNGTMTYDQALASLGYAGQAGTNFLNNAITSAGGNPLQLQSRGAVQQSNIQQSGTAQTDIARQGLADATQTYVTMNASAQYASQQSNAVLDILNKTGLNNTSSADYNKVINNIRGRFSDPEFASLNTALQEARASYTQLLASTGGTPTGREEIALSTLDTNSTPQKIAASIQELENAVARRLQAQYGAIQQYQSNLGGGGNSGGGGAGGALTWDNILDYGF